MRRLYGFILVLTLASAVPAFSQQRWERNYGGWNYEQGYSVQQTADGGYVIAGETGSFGNNNQVYLIKTNASGDTLWTNSYGGTLGEGGHSVQQTTDGGYVVSGGTSSFGNGNQAYLVRTNASGDTLWARDYGGAGTDRGFSVQQTRDGGFVVVGYTSSFGNGGEVYLIKANAFGDTLWTRTYGGTGSEWGFSVQQTSDGGYIVAGYTLSFGNSTQVYLVKTNALGDTLWTRLYGGTIVDVGRSVQQTTDGGYIIAGETSSFGNAWQVYLIKTDENGSSGVEENSQGDKETRGQGERLRATPNPFTSFAAVPGHEAERFSLYDISGRKVGTYRGDRIGEGLKAGVYFVRALDREAGLERIVKIR